MMDELQRELGINSALHQRIKDEVLSRVRMSQAALGDRYSQWATNEKLFNAYVPESENDAIRRGMREDGQPQYTTIEIPYSYAQVLSAHTYFTSVFLARDVVFQMQGRHGESENQVLSIESLLSYQLQAGKNLPAMYVWLMDPGKYGIGVLGYYWDRKTVSVTKRVEEPVTFLGLPIPGKFQTVERNEELVKYEGMKFFNVRPQDWLPDPRVTFGNFQQGEYVGRYVQIPWNEIACGEIEGYYFNVDVLRKRGKQGSYVFDRQASHSSMTLPGESTGEAWLNQSEVDRPSIIEAYEVFIRLIPSEWGLGKRDRPELWAFTLAGDEVVIGCQPLGYWHGEFPFAILESEIEGYGLWKRSTMESLQPLNQVVTWLFNSHFYNVRKSINDMFVYDPSMIVGKDLENPEPGKLIRLRPNAYGRDVRQFIHQFGVNDITQSHMRDATVAMDMMQRLSGVNESIMGMVNSGGAKTATEVRASTSYGMNRLKSMCEYFSATGFASLAEHMVMMGQQYMPLPKKYRIAGDRVLTGDPFQMIMPEDVVGFFDFVPVDGSMPVDRYAQSQMWTQLLGQISQVPQIASQYDIGKIFGWVAQLAGIRNLNSFKVQVVPDQMMAQQQQAGNSVPVGQSDLTRVPDPGRPNGMGATG